MLSTLKNYRPKFRAFWTASILALIGSGLVGCDSVEPKVDEDLGIPRQVYDEVPLYDGPVNSVGTLTQAYIRNTEGLMVANSRLRTLCIVHGQCKTDQE